MSVTSDSLPSNVDLEDNSTCEQIMTQKMTESDITQSTVDIDQSTVDVDQLTVDVDQSTVLLKNDNDVITVSEVETPAPVIMECEIRYPRLDSLMEGKTMNNGQRLTVVYDSSFIMMDQFIAFHSLHTLYLYLECSNSNSNSNSCSNRL